MTAGASMISESTSVASSRSSAGRKRPTLQAVGRERPQVTQPLRLDEVRHPAIELHGAHGAVAAVDDQVEGAWCRVGEAGGPLQLAGCGGVWLLEDPAGEAPERGLELGRQAAEELEERSEDAVAPAPLDHLVEEAAGIG